MNKEILEITKKFHDTYEKLASEYTYETREDTKVFDINSNNGKLMYATVNEIVSPILKENLKLKNINEEYERLNKEKCRNFKITNVQKYNIDELLSYKKYKDNWVKLKEYLHNVDVVIDYSENYDGSFINYDELINKMQELEQGSDSNEDN